MIGEPTPTEREQAIERGGVWGAVRPFLTRFEIHYSEHRATAMALVDLLAIEIADAVTAALPAPGEAGGDEHVCTYECAGSGHEYGDPPPSDEDVADVLHRIDVARATLPAGGPTDLVLRHAKGLIRQQAAALSSAPGEREAGEGAALDEAFTRLANLGRNLLDDHPVIYADDVAAIRTVLAFGRRLPAPETPPFCRHCDGYGVTLPTGSSITAVCPECKGNTADRPESGPHAAPETPDGGAK